MFEDAAPIAERLKALLAEAKVYDCDPTLEQGDEVQSHEALPSALEVAASLEAIVISEDELTEEIFLKELKRMVTVSMKLRVQHQEACRKIAESQEAHRMAITEFKGRLIEAEAHVAKIELKGAIVARTMAAEKPEDGDKHQPEKLKMAQTNRKRS